MPMNEQSDKIRKTLRLTPEQKRERRLEMIRLRDVEKLTLQQIGDRYGISKEAVRLQLKKGPEVRPSGTPKKADA